MGSQDPDHDDLKGINLIANEFKLTSRIPPSLRVTIKKESLVHGTMYTRVIATYACRCWDFTETETPPVNTKRIGSNIEVVSQTVNLF